MWVLDHKASGERPGVKPNCSTMATASGKCEARASGSWASLPKLIDFPPSSAHHWGIQDHRRRVFISRARSLAAMARIASRKPSSNCFGSKGPSSVSGHMRIG